MAWSRCCKKYKEAQAVRMDFEFASQHHITLSSAPTKPLRFNSAWGSRSPPVLITFLPPLLSKVSIMMCSSVLCFNSATFGFKNLDVGPISDIHSNEVHSQNKSMSNLGGRSRCQGLRQLLLCVSAVAKPSYDTTNQVRSPECPGLLSSLCKPHIAPPFQRNLRLLYVHLRRSVLPSSLLLPNGQVWRLDEFTLYKPHWRPSRSLSFYCRAT